MARALIQGTVLKWARESRGLSLELAAEKLKLPTERVESWEDGDSSPTIKQLRTIARHYKRPIGVFYLSRPPKDEELVKDFRRMPDAHEAGEERSPELRLEMRLARERRREALELVGALGIRPERISLRATLRSDPDKIAHSIVGMLRVRPSDRADAANAQEAFNMWTRRLEGAGALVFQTGGQRGYKVEPREARGFAIAEHPLPVIVVNGTDEPTARCFSLMHEFTHVLLQRSGLCDQHESPGGREEDRVEVFCNRVSGAVLVPREELEANPLVQAVRGRQQEWTDEDLDRIARRFRVSQEVVLRRLVIIGRATGTFYRQWREAHPYEPRAREDGFITPSQRVVKRNGRRFPRLVLTAYNEGEIPLSDVVQLLDIGPQHLSKIVDLVA